MGSVPQSPENPSGSSGGATPGRAAFWEAYGGGGAPLAAAGKDALCSRRPYVQRGSPIDAKQVGSELGVRYGLEGSVRRVGEKVEINAQLNSTETGGRVWADRFEGERSKLGELQLEFVSRLANSLGAELVKAEALRSTRERPGNPDAVDLAMQAQVKWNFV